MVFFYWVRKLVGVVFLASAAVVAYMLVTTLECGAVEAGGPLFVTHFAPIHESTPSRCSVDFETSLRALSLWNLRQRMQTG